MKCPAAEIAQLLGWSTATVHVMHSRWAKEGEAIFNVRERGGRHHQHLTQEQEAELLAQKRGGKQVLNTVEGSKAVVCTPAVGDHVAVIGTSRKLLVFPLDQVPVMQRGQGVALQKYKGAHLSDAKCFAIGEGLSWVIGDRVRVEEDVKPWLGARAGQGHLPPVGFPRSNKFSG